MTPKNGKHMAMRHYTTPPRFAILSCATEAVGEFFESPLKFRPICAELNSMHSIPSLLTRKQPEQR